MSHSLRVLGKIADISYALNAPTIEELARKLVNLRDRREGRLFILGVGGSAANASHAANDFAKLCDVEAYAPTDNVAEITARTNDEGWSQTFIGWLKARRLTENDAIMVLSVGGGSKNPEVSMPLVTAIDYANLIGAQVFGIVGRDGGYTKEHSDLCIMIPVVDPDFVTPLTESMQSVVLHALASHPILATRKAKWESL